MVVRRVFERCADDFLGESDTPDSIASLEHVVGLFLPTYDDVQFTTYEDSRRKASRVLGECIERGKAVGLVLAQCGWYSDTQVNAHLGVLKEFRGFAEALSQKLGQERLRSDEGLVRYIALVNVTARTMNSVIEIISQYQKESFLVVGDAVRLQGEALLSEIVRKGTDRFYDEKKRSGFSWVQMWPSLEARGVVVVRAIGWKEEFCDFRYIAVGTELVLADLFKSSM